MANLNLSLGSIIQSLPPKIFSDLSIIFLLTKILLGVILLLFLVKIIKVLFEIKKSLKIIQISDKVNEMDKKLDLILSKKGKKEQIK